MALRLKLASEVMMFIFNVIGAWLIAAAVNPLAGFYFFLVGNIFGSIFAHMLKARWLLALNFIFAIINIKGIMTW